MPPNIFANTGTNVSVIFIDKLNADKKVVLIDASKLGDKVKDGKNQRTVLKPEEEQQIVKVFSQCKAIDDFSVVVGYDEIKDKNHSFAAGQYFEIKIPHVNITEKEFKRTINEYSTKLVTLFNAHNRLENQITQQIDSLTMAGGNNE